MSLLPSLGRTVCRAVMAQSITTGPVKTSGVVGELAKDEDVTVLETRMVGGGLRVRCVQGWVSADGLSPCACGSGEPHENCCGSVVNQ